MILLFFFYVALAYSEDFSKRVLELPLASECKQEIEARKLLPAKRGDCKHAWVLAQEFRQNFSDLTRLCQKIDKKVTSFTKVQPSEREVLIKRMRAYLNPPSYGQVVSGALLESNCEDEMARVHKYRNSALLALTPLIKKLDGVAKTSDPDDMNRSRFSW